MFTIIPHSAELRLAVRPYITYAVILLSDVTSDASEPIARDADFEAMLSATSPSGDADLTAAWQKHAPRCSCSEAPSRVRPTSTQANWTN